MAFAKKPFLEKILLKDVDYQTEIEYMTTEKPP